MENTTQLSPSDLRILRRVAMARSMEITKPALSSLYLEPRGPGVLTAAATTGCMLAFANLQAEHHLSAPVLIPAAVCSILARLRLEAKPGTRTLCTGATLRDTGGLVEITLHELRSGVNVDTTITTARGLLTFPNWRKILGTDPFMPAPALRFPSDMLATADAILRTFKYDGASFQARCMTPNGGAERVALAHNDGVVVGLMPFVLAKDPVPDILLQEAVKVALAQPEA